MVTLLGFFFILSNVICLVIFMPDLVGPVSKSGDFLVWLSRVADNAAKTGPIMVVL
jgi:ethanolaminephosphotransferase